MNKRLLITTLGVFFLFSLLIVQFYRLQVVQHPKWLRRAHAQQKGVVTEPFKRGTFWTSGGLKAGHPTEPHPLVIDIPKFHLHADPASIPLEHKERVAEKIAAITGTPSKQKELQKRSRNRRLVGWLDRETHDTLLEWWLPYARKHKIARNALFFVKDYQRSYPSGPLLGQVLHTIRNRKEEGTKQGIPTGGLESAFNEYLKGKEGKRLVLRSPRHSLELGTVLEAPEDGADIYLTVNHYLQAIAEEEIEIAVRNAEARRGWAILMDPYTGEILALAQYPSFNPAHYRDFFNNPDKITDTLVHGLSDAYEPGSTIKPITLAIALLANEELARRGEAPLFSPDKKISVANGKFPGRSKLVTDVSPLRAVNMDIALQKSSNVYMARLMQRVGDRLGAEWHHKTLKEVFGFGKPTGIELPGETAGFVPTPGKTYASGATEWSKGTPYTLAMGYNLQVSSLQMLRAWAMFANGGYPVQPKLVRRIVKGRETLFELKSQLGKRLLSPQLTDRLIRSLRFTTHAGGTCARGRIPNYTAVGKTGTTEKLVNGKYDKRVHFSTFIGFAPVENPRFVCLIAIDEPTYYVEGKGRMHFGGKCAAPAFKEIGRRTLDYLGVPPDDLGDSWSKEVEALQRICEQWNSN